MTTLHLFGGVRVENEVGPLAGRIAQRHRLALLALLAGNPGGLSRDKLLGLLWPERDTAHARNLLSQAVHAVRAELGRDVLLSEGSSLRLDPRKLRVDLWEFERALGCEQWEAAAQAYEGAFLDGLYVPEAHELDEWLSGERARLGRGYATALERLAEGYEQGGDGARAVDSWRALAAHDPLSSRVALRLMRALELFGNRAAALQHGLAHQTLLRDELGVEPDLEVRARMEQLRTAPMVAEREAIAVGPQVAIAGASTIPMSPRRREWRGRWRAPRMIAAAVGTMAVVGFLAARWEAGAAAAGLATPEAALRGLPPDAPTRSALAYSLYRRGRRELHEKNAMDAFTLFSAALAEDSTFAMAAYYAGLLSPPGRSGTDDLARAGRLADRAPDRDRLYIRLQIALLHDDPASIAFADTIVTRFKDDPDVHAAAGQVFAEAGDFAGAITHLRTAVAIDSARGPSDPADCICDARGLLSSTYFLADSTAAGLRVARAYVDEWPHSVEAWGALGWALQETGRYEEARATWARMAQMDPLSSAPIIEASNAAIRAGDFQTADRVLAGRAASSPVLEGEGLWQETISLRYQGRLREALTAATRLRQYAEGYAEGPGPPMEAMAQAAVLFDLQRYRQAAALYDSLAAAVFGGAPDAGLVANEARGRAWRLTLGATARAAAGDTTGLRAVAERVRVLGTRSLYGRDALLYHHILGSLYEAEGNDAAAEVELRHAIYSATLGFTRTNLELARVLMRQGRPPEAIPLLRAALAGSLEASNMYVTHTELRELLGRAYEAAGEPDSAAVEYRWVLNAWKNADPIFDARRAEVRGRLGRVEAHQASRD